MADLLEKEQWRFEPRNSELETNRFTIEPSYIFITYLLFFFKVTHELTALDNLHKVAASENLPKYDTSIVIDALLDSHSEVILLTATGGKTSNGRNNWTSPGD